MTAPVKMTWDGAADQHLLLAILKTQDVKVDFEVVAVQLGCTGRAVQERLKKLKKMAAEHAGADPTAAAAVVAPKTPTKSKAKAAAKSKGASAGGAEDGTPSSKKRKVATPKSGKANGKEGSGVKEVGGQVEVKAEEVEAGMVGEEGVGGTGIGDSEGEMGEYAMGPSEMSQVVKEEDLLDDGHDPVLYDAHIGLLSSEI